jgi:hypothetical protein
MLRKGWDHHAQIATLNRTTRPRYASSCLPQTSTHSCRHILFRQPLLVLLKRRGICGRDGVEQRFQSAPDEGLVAITYLVPRVVSSRAPVCGVSIVSMDKHSGDVRLTRTHTLMLKAYMDPDKRSHRHSHPRTRTLSRTSTNTCGQCERAAATVSEQHGQKPGLDVAS